MGGERDHCRERWEGLILSRQLSLSSQASSCSDSVGHSVPGHKVTPTDAPWLLAAGWGKLEKSGTSCAPKSSIMGKGI